MGFDQVPIDHVVTKERIDMLVRCLTAGAIQLQIFPVAYSGHELDSQQVGQSKNREVLALGIGVNGRGFDG